MTASAAQLRAARTLLDRGQSALAASAGVTLAALKNVESGAGGARTMAALQTALESAGIVFLDGDGVQKAGPKSQAVPSRPIRAISTLAPQAHALPELMTLSEVRAFLQVSHSTVYEWISVGKFPKQIKFSEKVVRWNRAEVMLWFDSLSRGV